MCKIPGRARSVSRTHIRTYTQPSNHKLNSSVHTILNGGREGELFVVVKLKGLGNVENCLYTQVSLTSPVGEKL